MSDTQTLERSDRARIDNIRFAKPGRPRGMADLSQQTKAEIVIAKNLHQLSHPSIASQFNISRQTVQMTTEESLKPEGKKHLKSFIDKLGDIREETSDLILEKLRNKTIKDGVLPGLLNIANANYRLETGQPTSITADNYKTFLDTITQYGPAFLAIAANEFAKTTGQSEEDLRLAGAKHLEAINKGSNDNDNVE